MNYIKQLQVQTQCQKAYSDSLEQGLNELLAYLASPKFDDDPTVQKMDIVNRIRAARAQAILDAMNVGAPNE